MLINIVKFLEYDLSKSIKKAHLVSSVVDSQRPRQPDECSLTVKTDDKIAAVNAIALIDSDVSFEYSSFISTIDETRILDSSSSGRAPRC